MFELVLAFQLFTSPTADSPMCEPGQVSEIDNCVQGQLPDESIGQEIDPVPPICEETIGRVVDIDGTLWVVIGVDENCEPEMGLAPVPNFEPKPIPVDQWGRPLLDENGVLIDYPGPPEPAAVPTPVTSQVLDVAPDPTNGPELAETGVDPEWGFVYGALLISLGLGLMRVAKNRH